ncbi:hypothetical protein E2C01_056431 [Portunus trituberculatus]|uniref:Uncharacterized protein n=1 Tax=Portunus trituberculatus TaxID=210409 RepID=A0A5B7GZ52_PORTR|nr:hypothetical protein [Portunus trituberculatus]
MICSETARVGCMLRCVHPPSRFSPPVKDGSGAQACFSVAASPPRETGSSVHLEERTLDSSHVRGHRLAVRPSGRARVSGCDDGQLLIWSRPMQTGHSQLLVII